MKKKGIIVSPYLDSAMVEKIYRGMGMSVPNDRKAQKQYADGIDEDIPEDFWYSNRDFYYLIVKSITSL